MNETITAEQFNELLTHHEGENLDFKEAKGGFDERELFKYCSALANEGGGKLILGVTDKKPRVVSGTTAFINTHHELPNKIFDLLRCTVKVNEFIVNNKRALVISVPPKKITEPVMYNGAYYRRVGSSLKTADNTTVKDWLNEDIGDYSATILKHTSINDIDPIAIDIFKEKWSEKQGKPEYRTYSTQKTLSANHLIDEHGQLTCAALILFGRERVIRQFFPGAEIRYEWRLSAGNKYDAHKNWFAPFFSIYDDIWSEINNRTPRFPYQEGFIQKDIFAFTEKPKREAVLNAVAHRDYTLKSESIFIKASPLAFIVASPGGFLPNVSPDTILTKTVRHHPRNKLICEILDRAGLVERSGQGLEDIFRITIEEGKGAPSFIGSDNQQVVISIPATVTDSDFVKFLEKTAQEKQITFSLEEIIELEQIKSNQQSLRSGLIKKFLELGIVEKIGRTRNIRYILSHSYYSITKKSGVYTKLVGFSREMKKNFIIEHIKKNRRGYAKELSDAKSELTPKDINNLLQELKKEGKIKHTGSRRTGYWELVIK